MVVLFAVLPTLSTLATLSLAPLTARFLAGLLTMPVPRLVVLQLRLKLGLLWFLSSSMELHVLY
jgi:hypothetical protein